LKVRVYRQDDICGVYPLVVSIIKIISVCHVKSLAAAEVGKRGEKPKWKQRVNTSYCPFSRAEVKTVWISGNDRVLFSGCHTLNESYEKTSAIAETDNKHLVINRISKLCNQKGHAMLTVNNHQVYCCSQMVFCSFPCRKVSLLWTVTSQRLH